MFDMEYPTTEAEKLRYTARARENERVVLRNNLQQRLRVVDD